mgnify:CR=1 FL=1
MCITLFQSVSTESKSSSKVFGSLLSKVELHLNQKNVKILFQSEHFWQSVWAKLFTLQNGQIHVIKYQPTLIVEI